MAAERHFIEVSKGEQSPSLQLCVCRIGGANPKIAGENNIREAEVVKAK